VEEIEEALLGRRINNNSNMFSRTSIGRGGNLDPLEQEEFEEHFYLF